MKQTSTRASSRAPWFGKKPLPLRFYGALEPLESREVLAANVLASAVDTISPGNDTDDILMILGTPDTPGARVTLQLQMVATDGSLNPAAPRVLDSAGNAISATMMNNAVGTSGMTIVELGAGEYTILASSQGGTTGGYTLSASLLGDVEAADSRVSDFERLRASAAMTQFLGTGNFVTDLFYQTRGIDMGVSQYDPGFDANADGGVDASEFALVESNIGSGAVAIEFIPDTTAPVISNLALFDDTGVSSSDSITSNASITGQITDERDVSQILAALDGGTLVDVTDSVSLNASGTFVANQTVMNSLAGGTLADGAHTFSIIAVDDLGNTTDPAVTFDFVFIRTNTPPTTTGIADASATEDSAFSLNIANSFADQTADVLSFTLTGPSWLTLSSAGAISGTPLNADVGTASVTVTATDFDGATVSSTFDLTVINTNDAPVVAAIPNQTAEEDVAFLFDLSSFVSDEDVGDTVDIAALQIVDGAPVPLPAWLTFNEATSTLSGTPSDGDSGVLTISVVATDSAGLLSDQTFTITVQNVNDAPQFSGEIADLTLNEGTPIDLNVASFFSDDDLGDTLTFSAALEGGAALPDWLSISAAGDFSGTADDADIGTITVVVTATDSFPESVSSNSFTITVNNVDEAPTVSNQTFRVRPSALNGETFGTIVATDPDSGDTVTFAVTGGTGSAAFLVGASTGDITVSDRTLLVDGDTLTLNVTVTDSTGLTDTALLTISVAENAAPVAVDDSGFVAEDLTPLEISGAALTANDTDEDGDTLSVSAVSALSAEGATVTLNGDGSVTYDASSSSTLVSLDSGESMADTFTYTVSDGNGGTDMAIVSVNVTGTGPDVQFILRTFNLDGNEVTAVDPGDKFELRVFVQDIRPSEEGLDQGIFSAFLDVTYNANLASVDGSIDFSEDYDAANTGSTVVAGVIDEVGGIDGISPLGTDEFEVFRLQFEAGTTDGLLVFGSNPTEDQIQRPVLLFGQDVPLPSGQIEFGTTSLAIGNVAPLAGGGNGITNLANPFDVNGDSQVTPLDALMVINVVNGSHDGSGLYYDVNADGVGSPLDALLVINEMTTATLSAPITEGEIQGQDGSTLAVDELFAAIHDESIELGQPWDDIVDFFQDSPTLIDEVADYISDLEDGEEVADFNDWLLGLQGLL